MNLEYRILFDLSSKDYYLLKKYLNNDSIIFAFSNLEDAILIKRLLDISTKYILENDESEILSKVITCLKNNIKCSKEIQDNIDKIFRKYNYFELSSL